MSRAGRTREQSKIYVMEWLQKVKDASTNWKLKTEVFHGQPCGFDKKNAISGENNYLTLQDANLIKVKIENELEYVMYCGPAEDKISEKTYKQYVDARTNRINGRMTGELKSVQKNKGEFNIKSKEEFESVYKPNKKTISHNVSMMVLIRSNLMIEPKTLHDFFYITHTTTIDGEMKTIVNGDVRLTHKHSRFKIKGAIALGYIKKIDTKYHWIGSEVTEEMAKKMACEVAYEKYVSNIQIKQKALNKRQTEENLNTKKTNTSESAENSVTNESNTNAINSDSLNRNLFAKEYLIRPNYGLMPVAELLKLDFNTMTEREIQIFIAQTNVRIIANQETRIIVNQETSDRHVVRMANAIEKATSRD